MNAAKADIINGLKQEILSLQGFKSVLGNNEVDTGLGNIKQAFPNAVFPLAAIHEFISDCPEHAAATTGFVSGIISTLMKNKGAVLWVTPERKIFPPALSAFGVAPDKIVFVHVRNKNEIIWTIEEALKCESLSAVVGELPELSFKASRKLQLAVEQSKVTGFILRNAPKTVNITASVTRWRITTLPGVVENDMPGVGFPKWNVELLKVRNGKPGNWQLQFYNGAFHPVQKVALVQHRQHKKAV